MRVMLVALSLVLCVPWSCPALAQSAIHITFEGLEVGKPPPGWVSRNGNIGDVYTVQEEGGKKFLHADARGTAVQIGFEAKWSLKEHPSLEWQWRALILPDKGDEMKKATNDSVLGLYVVFGRQPFIKTVKYVWSTTLPIGLSLESPFSSRTRMIVLESGDALLGNGCPRGAMSSPITAAFSARTIPRLPGASPFSRMPTTRPPAPVETMEISISLNRILVLAQRGAPRPPAPVETMAISISLNKILPRSAGGTTASRASGDYRDIDIPN